MNIYSAIHKSDEREWLKKRLAEKPAGYFELMRKADYHYRRYDALHLKADRLLAGAARAEEAMGYEEYEDCEHAREHLQQQIDDAEFRAAKLYTQAEAAFDKYLALRTQADAMPMPGSGQGAEPV